MSIKKVADIAGVSIATVSRYFNNPKIVKKETLEKVESAIKAIDYQPNTLAKNFRRGKSGIIVVVVHNIGNPVYENLTQTMTQTAQLKGYEILIKETNNQCLPLEYYRDMLSSKQVDGLIVMVDLPKMSKEKQAALADLPIVLVKGETINRNTNPQYIGLDNYEAAKTATNHLIELGHSSIACITTNNENVSDLRRKAGFIAAMKIAELNYKQSIYTICQPKSVEAIIQQLSLLSPKPTAIFCINDDIAIDALHTAKKYQIKVPEELSVIGFDNIRYSAHTVPPLTTIKQPIADIALYSIEVLCSKIDGSDIQTRKSEQFNHHLVIRSSTSRPPI